MAEIFAESARRPTAVQFTELQGAIAIVGVVALLVIFAVLAGAGTALTPCVLPVLPALLSASAAGGRRRPLGVILGLVTTHTLAIVALASVIDGVGLADDFARTAAVVVLALFGVALLWPRLGLLVERALAPLQRLGPTTRGSGFWSGIVVGGALGFLYAPCAGPILAAVISLSATQGASADLVVVALAYGAGSAAVLLLIAFGGRAVVERIRRAGHGPSVQRALGVLLLGTAVAMAAELDVRFQTVLANEVPTVFSNPTSALERSDAISGRLADLRGPSRFDEADPASGLPVLGRAPDFTGNDSWLNTRGDRPLSLGELRGRVVLIDFWTYTCINCLRTMPALRAWHERYARDGLVIVGVHTPEFAFERERDNVERAVRDNDLRYPIAQDNEYATWNAWGNQYWPAKYLIDAEGRVRYAHFGEGAYSDTERAIRMLLAEAGERRLPDASEVQPGTAAAAVRTPETYLGTLRADGFAGSPPEAGRRSYPEPPEGLEPSQFALTGTWDVDGERATAAADAEIHARPVAREVYLVMASRDARPRRVRVLLDGRPIPTNAAGPDVSAGAVTVQRQRLYRLVSLPEVGEHDLKLRMPPGVSAYAFTFG
jgi:cytochrome c biogenesis protein CcdA/thiol-disulfide isomerase/thioredoxin